MVDVNPGGFIHQTSAVTIHHSMKFQQLQDAFKYSHIKVLWNNLPNELAISPSLDSLKNKLNNHVNTNYYISVYTTILYIEFVH